MSDVTPADPPNPTCHAAVTLHLNPGITLVCFQSFSGI
jgi:hypothetical protein